MRTRLSVEEVLAIRENFELVCCGNEDVGRLLTHVDAVESELAMERFAKDAGFDTYAAQLRATQEERDAALAKLAAVEQLSEEYRRRAERTEAELRYITEYADGAAAATERAVYAETSQRMRAEKAEAERDEARAALAAATCQRGHVTIGPPLQFSGGGFELDDEGGDRGE